MGATRMASVPPLGTLQFQEVNFDGLEPPALPHKMFRTTHVYVFSGVGFLSEELFKIIPARWLDKWQRDGK